MMDEEGCVEHEDYLKSLIANGVGESGGSNSSDAPLGQNNGSGATNDPFMRSKLEKKERELNEVRRKQQTLIFIRNMMGIVTIASLAAFDWNSSLVLSQCILVVYFTFGTQSSFIVWAYTHSKVESDIINPEKARAGMIWRGFLMSATISIVVDSMSMVGNGVLHTLIFAEKLSLTLGLIPVSIFMIIRLAVNLLALVQYYHRRFSMIWSRWEVVSLPIYFRAWSNGRN